MESLPCCAKRRISSMSTAAVRSPRTGSILFAFGTCVWGTKTLYQQGCTETMLVWSMVIPPLRSVWFRILHQNGTEVDADDFLLTLPMDVVVGGMNFAV